MAEADPHKVYNVHDAKTNLSKLIDRAHAGEEIVLAKAGAPMARLMPLDPAAGIGLDLRRPGRLAHLRDQVPSDIWFEPNFTDEELDRFEAEGF
ncbi:type II toxin-antitoxin system Phd/YefM family antitoxin [Sphingomonas japonica]|uniref:Antitoxin n=1 Tax=Sphingomonas japonica TaxID=511662 RepID=A0ABX0TXP4_9SPHN|nr:type II toxin-antitoxin system prevent-host-death family antitoxin [Sphingomonas japonica]NIJ22630.1 prevent-host-death family protein [Sphingomonas japonica]